MSTSAQSLQSWWNPKVTLVHRQLQTFPDKQHIGSWSKQKLVDRCLERTTTIVANIKGQLRHPKILVLKS